MTQSLMLFIPGLFALLCGLLLLVYWAVMLVRQRAVTVTVANVFVAVADLACVGLLVGGGIGLWRQQVMGMVVFLVASGMMMCSLAHKATQAAESGNWPLAILLSLPMLACPFLVSMSLN